RKARSPFHLSNCRASKRNLCTSPLSQFPRPSDQQLPSIPRRPLSYDELVQQQRLAEGREREFKAAQQDYESQIESGFASPLVTRIHSFRPHPTTQRARRAEAQRRKLGQLAYPFPEDSQQSQGRREIQFPTGHRIRLARFRRFQRAALKHIARMEKEVNSK